MKRLWVLMLIFCFMNCGYQGPVVEIRTQLGPIKVRLFPQKAPVTVENFLRYVDASRFQGAAFYRTVTLANQPDDSIKIEVIQGGLWDEVKMADPIRHETTRESGLKHLDGVISMARSQPGTATSEFFICVGNQPELDFGGQRNPDGQGFAAFGQVVDGMDVVRRIHQSPANGQMLDPRIPILEIVRVQ